MARQTACHLTAQVRHGDGNAHREVAASDRTACLSVDPVRTAALPREPESPISTDSVFVDQGGASNHQVQVEILTTRSRNALPITDTELRLIAAAATMGDSSRPNSG